MFSLNLDCEKTRVVLIGASFFPRDEENLPPIPQIVNNLNSLSQIFADKQIIGISESNITQILDESAPDKVLERLAQISRKTEDTLIVYYAGHGLIGRTPGLEGKLLLAVKNTTDGDAAFNSIHFEDFWSAILVSQAPKKILIVDCCFSGRAISELKSPLYSKTNRSTGNINLTGTYVITSTSPNTPYAIPPENEKYTYFSSQLIKTFQEGIDDRKSGINLEELYENIRYKLSRIGKPEPKRANFGDADRITIALNRKFSLSSDKSNKKEPIRPNPEPPKPPKPSKRLAGIIVIAGILSALIFALYQTIFGLRDEKITVQEKYVGDTIYFPESGLSTTVYHVKNSQGERFSISERNIDLWYSLKQGETYCVKLFPGVPEIQKVVDCEVSNE